MKKQGDVLKIHLRELNNLLTVLLRHYSTDTIHSLKSRSKEAQDALIELEHTTPASKGEQYEKTKLLELYTAEFDKILQRFQKIPFSSPVSTSSVSKLSAGGAQNEVLQAQAYEEEVIDDRNKEIHELASCLQEIHGMLVFCGESVAEQGQQLDRIENFAEISCEETSKANEELMTAEQYQRRATQYWMWILLSILTAVALACMVFYL